MRVKVGYVEKMGAKTPHPFLFFFPWLRTGPVYGGGLNEEAKPFSLFITENPPLTQTQSQADRKSEMPYIKLKIHSLFRYPSACMMPVHKAQ